MIVYDSTDVNYFIYLWLVSGKLPTSSVDARMYQTLAQERICISFNGNLKQSTLTRSATLVSKLIDIENLH